MNVKSMLQSTIAALLVLTSTAQAQNDYTPYDGPRTKRAEVYSFTQKPTVTYRGNDRYEITFAVKAACDVTIGMIDSKGTVVRHLGSGVLGTNAPSPFQKGQLVQKIYWDGKNDLGAYVREPGALRVRVSLGLKPEFDKRLGGTSPKNIPGYVLAITADPSGVYVFSQAARFYLRKFNHDASYKQSLVPPPANMPRKKLTGSGYVEYEAGKKTPHAIDAYSSISARGNYLPYFGKDLQSLRPTISKGRIFYVNSGVPIKSSKLYYVGTDGSTSPLGSSGRTFLPHRTHQTYPRLASSPDGKWIYFADGENDGRIASYSVWRCSADGTEPPTPFISTFKTVRRRRQFKLGSEPGQFNVPRGMDTDTQGRLYVCDTSNNRVQIFSPEGKYLKEFAIDRPSWVDVHKKTNGIYVYHSARIKGKSVGRLTKFASFKNPKPVAHVDVKAGVVALDSWSAKPRIWMAGGTGGKATNLLYADARNVNAHASVTVWEEDGATFKLVSHFEKEAREEAGKNYFGRWPGQLAKFEKLVCDPLREQAYYCNQFAFDLRSGALLKSVGLTGDDIAFDKRGYVHQHFNPGFYTQGVGRSDPDQPMKGSRRKSSYLPHLKNVRLTEVPYDYGVMPKKERLPWRGILPTKCQPGAKYFQDGLGVNMRGDVAVQSNIYHMPKGSEISKQFAMAANTAQRARGQTSDSPANNYQAFLKSVQESIKRGEDVYFIKRKPGIPLVGATLFTFDWSGELREECAATVGNLINGVQIDEDGSLYFINNRTKMINGKPFLSGLGGVFGDSKTKKNRNNFSGTLLKTRGQNVRFIGTHAVVPLQPPPSRPADLKKGGDWWVEGAEWLYAGASPIVAGGCSCPTMRASTDWYKRTFLSEAYRHSIGVLDANGNLIMHIGSFGNLDSGNGAKSKIPVGGDGIGIAFNAVVSATDNYLCFPDHGERLVVLKLNYHAEEIVAVRTK